MNTAMSANLQSLVGEMARRQARSPQQVECFQAGAEAIVTLIQQAGVEQTVLPEVRAELGRMKAAVNDAVSVRNEIRAEVARLGDPIHLDDRGKQVLALTGALLNLYGTTLLTGREDASTKNQIARAVSYSVWAYLNPGTPYLSDETLGSSADE